MDHSERQRVFDEYRNMTSALDRIVEDCETREQYVALQLAMLDTAAVLAMTVLGTSRKEFERAAGEIYCEYRPDRRLMERIKRIAEGRDGNNDSGQVPRGSA